MGVAFLRLYQFPVIIKACRTSQSDKAGESVAKGAAAVCVANRQLDSHFLSLDVSSNLTSPVECALMTSSRY